MPDIIQFATTGIVYRNGNAVIGGNIISNVQTIPVKIERSVVVAQSGSLDTRFDDRTYYSHSG